MNPFAVRPRPTVRELSPEPGAPRQQTLSDVAKRIRITPIALTDRDVQHKARNAPGDAPAVNVDSAETKLLRYGSYWEFTYKVVLSNPGATTLLVNAKLHWVDAEGFSLEQRNHYDVRIEPHGVATVTDTELIERAAASRVDHLKVELGSPVALRMTPVGETPEPATP